MGRGKKGRKSRRNDDWSDNEEEKVVAAGKEVEESNSCQKLSRKQKRLQKQQQKQQAKSYESEDDDIMALIKGGKKNDYGSDHELPKQKNKRKGKKGNLISAVEHIQDEEISEIPQDKRKRVVKEKRENQRSPLSSDEGENKSNPQVEREKKSLHISSSSDDAEEDLTQLKNKEKRKAKKGGIQTNSFSSEFKSSSSEDNKVTPQPVQERKQRNKKGKEQANSFSAAFGASSDDMSEEEREGKAKFIRNERRKKTKKKEEENPFAAGFNDSDEEDEDDNNDVEQIAFKIIDDGDDEEIEKKRRKEEEKKKKKEKKKEKKREEKEIRKEEKKKKKEKKKEKKERKTNLKDNELIDFDSNILRADESDDIIKPILTKSVDLIANKHETQMKEQKTLYPPSTTNRPKTKLELQIEAAMQKKREAETREIEKKQEIAKKIAEAEKKAAEEEEVAEREADEIRKRMEAEEATATEQAEEFYGHGDDAWTDKSAAQIEAEARCQNGPDTSLTHGLDGKKLSNKERKRLLKKREAAARMAEYEKVATEASRQGAQFACSQTAVNEKDPQWENSLEINIPNFSISAAGKVLFKDATMMISRGRRYGLVGPNGKGKSTLLKMIASAELKIPPRIDFLYVEQEVVADDTPAVEAVLKADKKRWDLLEEERILMEAVDNGDEDIGKLDRLQIVTEELMNMGADSAEAKARRILFGLGFDMEMQVKPTKMFSGGWRMRISLARALFIEPTLLMLDEPTNHLDLNAVIWLDDYLQRWKKTLLVVSHDQDFLNSVTQEILHIEDLKLISYKGNYDSFKKAEATRFKQQVKAWEKQEKRLRELKRGGKSKAKAQELVKTNSKREPGARSKKKKDDAVAAGQEAAVNTELIKRPKEYSVKFLFTEVTDIGRPVMEVNRVHFRYSARHPVIFDEVDFGIDMDSRICVVGPNGAGKSTLLKLMTGELQPTKGETRRNPRLRMGVYNQHFVDKLPMNKTPVEFLRDRFQNEDYQSVRNRLGKYGLEGHAHEVVMRDLSGGQKARVTFVELSLQQPHILLLDEPTNNLDIESIDALIDAINNFNGGIVVVTHDQRLIENCDCNLWVVEKEKVTPWEEGFEDYKDNLLREMEEEMEKQTEVRRRKLDEAAKAKSKKLELLASKLKS